MSALQNKSFLGEGRRRPAAEPVTVDDHLGAVGAGFQKVNNPLDGVTMTCPCKSKDDKVTTVWYTNR